MIELIAGFLTGVAVGTGIVLWMLVISEKTQERR